MSNSNSDAQPTGRDESEVRRRRVRKRVRSDDAIGDSGAASKRRKRRRTHQPEKQASKRPLYAVAGVFGGIFFLALAGSFSIGFHNSRSFRGELVEDLETGTAAEVELSQLRVSPTLATARKVEYQWEDPRSAVSRLVVNNLSSHYVVGGLLGGSWKGADLYAESGEVYLNHGYPMAAVDPFGYVEKYGIDRIQCKSLDIFTKDDARLISGTFASFKWGVTPMQLQVSGGIYNDSLFRGFSVDQGYVQMGQEANELSLKLRNNEGGGVIALNGVLDAKHGPFALEVSELPSSVLLGEVLGNHFMGEWDGKGGEYSMPHFSGSELGYDIHMAAPSVQLGRFECFALLAELLHKNSYRRPQFSRGGKLRVTKMGNVLKVHEVSLREQDGLALKGWLETKDAVVRGELEIGVPLREKAKLVKLFKQGTFATQRDGYFWHTVHVQGEGDKLSDDLRRYLKGVAEVGVETGGQAEEEVDAKGPTTQEELEKAFEDLISE